MIELTKKEIHESILIDPEIPNIMVNESMILTEDTVENVLMAVGFVPVIGSLADAILLIRYAIKGELLFAALMLICLVPAVGDWVAKPLIKGLKNVMPMLKVPGKLYGHLMKNKKIADLYTKAMGHVNSPTIDKFLKQIGKFSGRIEKNLRKAIDEHKLVYNKLIQSNKVGQRYKSIYGKSVPSVTKTVKRALLKNRIKDKNALVKYWYTWRQNRIFRNYIIKAVLAGKLVHLGLKKITDVDSAVNDPRMTEKLLNDQEFSNVMYDAEQMGNQEYNNSAPNTGDIPNMDDDSMINFIKKMAQSYA